CDRRWCRCSCCRSRGRCCSRGRGRCRRCRRRPTRAYRAIKDFHRCDDGQVDVVAACFPDVIGAIRVGCEVAPSNRKGSTHRPRIADWIVDLHLISGSVKIPTQHIHLATEVHRPSVAGGVGYVRKRADGISHRIIHKCVVRIGQSAARDISAATGVDEGPDGGGWQVAKRNWKDRTLLHPPRRTRRKLPNLISPHTISNIEPTHSDERVTKYRKATRQSASVARRVVASNQGNAVSNRIIAEDTTSHPLSGEIGTTYAVDIIRSAVVKYTASH